MSSLRARKILRDLWLHKTRTALVVAAIAIGILGAGSVLDTWALVRKVTVVQFLASNPPSATLKLDSVDAAFLADVRRRHDIRNAEARRTILVRGRSAAGTINVSVVAMPNLASNTIGAFHHERGTWPPRDGEAALEPSGATYARLSLGDTVALQLEHRSLLLPVTGIARDVTIPPGWMEHYAEIFVTPATLTLLGATPTMNELRLVVADSATDRAHIRRVAYDLKRAAESRGHTVYELDVPVPRQHIHAAQMNSFLFAQGAFGALALLLSCILVVNLMTALLTGQVREIGIMKSFGARDAQLSGMYLLLALALGIAACIIAIPAAAAIGRVYAQFTADLLNFRVEGVAIPRGVLVLQALAGALLPVCAAAGPVRRGCRVTVSSALRDMGIVDHDAATRSAAQLLPRATGVNRVVLLALRNALRRRQRTVLTALTLAVGAAMYIGALDLRRGVAASIDQLFAPWQYDVLVNLERATTIDSIEQALSHVQGVARSEAWSIARASVVEADGTMGNEFPITSLPPATRMVSTRTLSGRWLRDGEHDGIVVNARLVADDSMVDLGQVVALDVDGARVQRHVVGVVEMGTQPLAFAVREQNVRPRAAAVVSSRSGHAAVLDLTQRVRVALADVGLAVASTRVADAERSAIEDHLLMVADFLGIMSRLIIVIGGLGLAASMSIAVMERTREIGVLRAIGASQSAILRLVQLEGLAIALIACAVSLPLSMPMSYVLARVFGSIMLPTPAVYWPGVAGLMRWIVVVVVVSQISTMWPAWRAMRVPVQRALSYE